MIREQIMALYQDAPMIQIDSFDRVWNAAIKQASDLAQTRENELENRIAQLGCHYNNALHRVEKLENERAQMIAELRDFAIEYNVLEDFESRIKKYEALK
jgi:lipopolysaccharide biosynthesis regulator YciM